MKLLKPAKNQQAFGKVGFLGFAGSGKTYTATEMAIGIQGMIKSKKPIAFLDTETGADFMIPKAEKAGYELVVAKTRAFQDLLAVTAEAQEASDVLIIDSISHIWTELIESYLKKNSKKRLAFQDWGVIKPTWREFTDLYLTSRMHIIICGRAAFEWDYFENEEGKMELYKAGVKMRAETEFGYEPSLLIEMEKVKGNNGGLIHRAGVIKDRAQLLDGQSYDDPTFEQFKPHFQFLAIGGEHLALDTSRTSEDMFEPETGKPDWKLEREQIQVALEEIEAEMVKAGLAGQGKDEKKNKITMLEFLFRTSSWSAIQNMPLSDLKLGLDALRKAAKDKDFMEGIVGKHLTYDDYWPKKEAKQTEEKQVDIPF